MPSTLYTSATGCAAQAPELTMEYHFIPIDGILATSRKRLNYVARADEQRRDSGWREFRHNNANPVRDRPLSEAGDETIPPAWQLHIHRSCCQASCQSNTDRISGFILLLPEPRREGATKAVTRINLRCAHGYRMCSLGWRQWRSGRLASPSDTTLNRHHVTALEIKSLRAITAHSQSLLSPGAFSLAFWPIFRFKSLDNQSHISIHTYTNTQRRRRQSLSRQSVRLFRRATDNIRRSGGVELYQPESIGSNRQAVSEGLFWGGRAGESHLPDVRCLQVAFQNCAKAGRSPICAKSAQPQEAESANPVAFVLPLLRVCLKA
ncbi:unnamed protein product [Protopolystoma xenopodis]|uniref:Uncharacterized protein n=1 Tax=Protopolystoma xenopodis TaxID=117903 RepID=A0A448XD58_9PLAT|nr:unnamed protein product [Protopolystoma xenopodis]